CIVPSDTVVNTSEKKKPVQLKEQKDIQETPTSKIYKISESANDKIGDNRKFERIYISGCEKPKVLPVAVMSEKDNVECIKFDIESANRKEKITPGWCE
ncbi:24368_t:CDS:2, partial [Dentiscutata erythropus]